MGCNSKINNLIFFNYLGLNVNRDKTSPRLIRETIELQHYCQLIGVIGKGYSEQKKSQHPSWLKTHESNVNNVRNVFTKEMNTRPGSNGIQQN